MGKKHFNKTPQPKTISSDALHKFERSGVGKDQGKVFETKRLSFDIPLETHKRFKSLCCAHGTTMSQEIVTLIENRILELTIISS